MRRMLRIGALGIGLVLFSTNARAELFRVALSTKDFGYLPLFVGMRSGLFAQEGLEIQWIVVNSNVVVTALIAGEIDVAGIAAASCHTREELDRATALGFDFAVLGPVLEKGDAEPLGWERFAALVRGTRVPVYAIGGLQPAHMERAWRAGAHGIAMIRGSWNR